MTTSPRMRMPCPGAARSTAPWFVIPANHKWFRNLAVARIVVEQLEGLNMTFPEPTVDLKHIRKEYHSAEKG